MNTTRSHQATSSFSPLPSSFAWPSSLAVEPKHNKGRSKQDYATPPDFIAAACKRLAISTFTWDLAANAENKVAPNYFDETTNSLVQDWDSCGGWLWCNPPYANIAPWVAKASACTESQIAMLVPASVGANWWRDHVHAKAHTLFLNGRIKFVGAPTHYPRDCALLLYTPACKGGYEIWPWTTTSS